MVGNLGAGLRRGAWSVRGRFGLLFARLAGLLAGSAVFARGACARLIVEPGPGAGDAAQGVLVPPSAALPAPRCRPSPILAAHSGMSLICGCSDRKRQPGAGAAAGSDGGRSLRTGG